MGTPGDSALCSLVRAALPVAGERSCQVMRPTCLACCQAAPATPARWNPVVGSLIYQAARTVLEDPHAQPESRGQADRALQKARSCLDAISHGTRPQPVPPFANLLDLIPLPARHSPGPVRTWAVGVTTAPRARPTLEMCLDSLQRAGWSTPHLFMDSSVRVAERFGDLPGTLRSPAVGAWPNHFLALFELSMRQPDADAYLLLQDDALIYDGENVRQYLEAVLWPGNRLPVVSLFCPEPYTARGHGWHPLHQPWVWGAQALVFPRRILHQYLRDPLICQHRWRSVAGGLTQIDVLLGWWARRRRIPFWCPTPSLVQHIGETSTLWADCSVTGPRSASLFAGNKGTGPLEMDPSAGGSGNDRIP